MSEVLGDFIRALRSADIRVSTSESIDAGNVIDLVGFDDRQTLKDALSQVLAKSDDEKQAFAETFDTYFSFEQFKERPSAANENDERERQQGEEDGGEGEGGDPSQSGSASSPGGGGMSGDPQGEPSSANMDLAALLERGDQAELQLALAAGARQARSATSRARRRIGCVGRGGSPSSGARRRARRS